MRKELLEIRQRRGEPLFKYLKRFRIVKDNCHHLGIPENLLIEYCNHCKITRGEGNAQTVSKCTNKRQNCIDGERRCSQRHKRIQWMETQAEIKDRQDKILLRPSKTEQINAVELHSARQLSQSAIMKEQETLKRSDTTPKEEEKTTEQENETGLGSKNKVSRAQSAQALLIFPTEGKKQKKTPVDLEILELFSKVEINIPLLDAIK